MGRAVSARVTTQIAQQDAVPLIGIQQFPADNGAKRGCHTCLAVFRSRLQGDWTAPRTLYARTDRILSVWSFQICRVLFNALLWGYEVFKYYISGAGGLSRPSLGDFFQNPLRGPGRVKGRQGAENQLPYPFSRRRSSSSSSSTVSARASAPLCSRSFRPFIPQVTPMV